MSKPATPSSSVPAGDDSNLVAPSAPDLDEKLHAFWQKNRGAVIGFIVLVVIVLIAKGGWEIWQAEKQKELQKEYAAASTPEQLRRFADSHADQVLGGLAQLRIGDEAYAAGKSTDAAAAYEKALGPLKGTVLADRAELGRAMALIQAGKTDEGAKQLQQLVDDAKRLKAVRAEAAYHLASLAASKHAADDVKKYSDQLITIDPASPWTQRAMMLRASEGATGVGASQPAAADAEAAPQIKLNVPGQ